MKIVVRLKGGTGNQMFQYAFGQRLATELGGELFLDLSFLESKEHDELHVRRDFSLDVFGIKGPFYEGNIHSDLKWIVEDSFGFNRNLIPTEIQGGVLLDGYWQTEKYFSPIADTIWNQFSVSDATLARLDPVLVEKFSQSNAVCLNVRRGDFVYNERSKDFHGVLGMDYIRQGIAALEQQVHRPQIYVFSDDIQWCRDHIRLDHPVEVIGHEYAGDRFVDYLHYMSLFQNYLIPNSSFAWWAVWLSDYKNKDRRVVAPKRWFLDDSYCFDDLIPSSWVTI